MVRSVLFLAFFFFICHFVEASGKHLTDSTKLSQGIMVGGMLGEGESFLMGKYEYLINNVGLQIVASREALRRNIDFDSSLDKYLKVGYGLTFRYYVPDVLKGFYGGAALSSTTATLTTVFQNDKEKKSCNFLNLGGIELGYRLGGQRKGFTGEIGYRRMYNFNQLRLTTNGDVKFSDVNSGISPHAWNVESGDHFDKFFVGVGYVF